MKIKNILLGTVVGSLSMCGLVSCDNDFLEENLKWLKEGTINFLIGQDAAVQGHSPVIILFQLLFDSKAPEKEYQYTDIVIRTKYNMG